MEAIERVSTVQAVEERLVNYLKNDSVKVGDKLPTEKQLCEELKVGRGTVREAIRMLQAKNMVETRPGRGAFVLSKQESKQNLGDWFAANEYAIKDIIDIRCVLEPLAVKLMIERCTDDDIKVLRKIYEATLKAVAEHDVAKCAKYDERFHNKIFEYSRNKFLIDINKKIESSLKSFRSRTFYIAHNMDNLALAHGAIMEAIENKDVDKAVASMKSHINLITSDLERSKEG